MWGAGVRDTCLGAWPPVPCVTWPPVPCVRAAQELVFSFHLIPGGLRLFTNTPMYLRGHDEQTHGRAVLSPVLCHHTERWEGLVPWTFGRLCAREEMEVWEARGPAFSEAGKKELEE